MVKLLGHIFHPQFPDCEILCLILFFEKIYVSVLQTMFSFVGVQCETAAKAGMIIQRVVLNSRPGMYFCPIKEQSVCYGCLVLQNIEGRNRH